MCVSDDLTKYRNVCLSRVMKCRALPFVARSGGSSHKTGDDMLPGPYRALSSLAIAHEVSQ